MNKNLLILFCLFSLMQVSRAQDPIFGEPQHSTRLKTGQKKRDIRALDQPGMQRNLATGRPVTRDPRMRDQLDQRQQLPRQILTGLQSFAGGQALSTLPNLVSQEVTRLQEESSAVPLRTKRP